ASREDLHDLLLDACVAVKGTETCDHCAVQGLRRIEPPLRRRLGRAVLPHVLAPATAAGRRRLLGGPREGRRDPGAPSPVGRPAAPGEPSAAPPARPAADGCAQPNPASEAMACVPDHPTDAASLAPGARAQE